MVKTVEEGLVWLVTLEYAIAAGFFISKHNYAQATILAGYVLANIGLLWSFKQLNG